MQPSTTPRANRIPRISQPQPSLFRRLHAALVRVGVAVKRWYLFWLLYSLGKQLDEVEVALQETAIEAHSASRRHRVSPQLNARRRDLRRSQAVLAERLLTVRRELDSLEVLP